ncbi:protein phosphatase 1 regulatory subunit SDS22 [Rosa rugosa]|uniref:protein phosphatase 1 regulatory subunit SDS22 n=1 Tax=Rosa rugosa TaxID=74645 RepID=UPI002B40EC48|nr:protein phosphatase 1 regulatory subunit SDS22 [Rosa rugosa]
MKRGLSLDQVLKDNNTRDPNSISSLILTHRALSDVSCLGELKNLERLDLSANTLTSLEGLKSCVNLKWLSVSQNKLQSLKGIEGLSKLTVLNAGNNKLTVMDEVKSIVSLRALILNDNEIASICRLEQMKELNTLVLSKNPIRDIGDSLMNVKSIKKLSLSHCQLRSIQSSLKSCVELKELRLAHNNIEGLPAELAHNKGLQNLDLGNNVITRWSELKVLDSLVYLKNLNLQGNPVAEKDKLAKKIKKMLPNLHVFNARPIDKYTKNEKGARVDAVDEEKYRDSKHQGLGETKDSNLDNARELDMKRKRNREKANENVSDQEVLVQEDEEGDSIKKKKRHQVVNEDFSNLEDAADLEESKGKKLKKKGHKDDDTKVKKKLDKVKQQSELDIIDDADTPFLELFSDDKVVDAEDDGEQSKDKASHTKLSSGVVTITSSKAKKRSTGSTLPLLPVDEIGVGGPSTWD